MNLLITTIACVVLLTLNALEINFVITSDEPNCDSQLGISFQEWLKIKAFFIISLICFGLGIKFASCVHGDIYDNGKPTSRACQICMLSFQLSLILFEIIWYVIGMFIFWHDCYAIENKLKYLFWIDIGIYWLFVAYHSSKSILGNAYYEMITNTELKRLSNV